MIRIVEWDWKGGPQVADLKGAIEAFTSGPLRVHAVDTGSDAYTVLITDEQLDGAGVDAAYERAVADDVVPGR